MLVYRHRRQAISEVACRSALAQEIRQAKHIIEIRQDSRNETYVASERPPKFVFVRPSPGGMTSMSGGGL